MELSEARRSLAEMSEEITKFGESLDLDALNDEIAANEDEMVHPDFWNDNVAAQKVIDATGNQHAMNNTVNLIRHGGSIVFVGLFKGDLQFSDPEFHKKETTMMGSRNATPEDFAKVGRLMSEGKLTADMLLTHRYACATRAESYERDVINNRELIKGVITF